MIFNNLGHLTKVKSFNKAKVFYKIKLLSSNAFFFKSRLLILFLTFSIMAFFPVASFSGSGITIPIDNLSDFQNINYSGKSNFSTLKPKCSGNSCNDVGTPLTPLSSCEQAGNHYAACCKEAEAQRQARKDAEQTHLDNLDDDDLPIVAKNKALQSHPIHAWENNTICQDPCQRFGQGSLECCNAKNPPTTDGDGNLVTAPVCACQEEFDPDTCCGAGLPYENTSGCACHGVTVGSADDIEGQKRCCRSPEKRADAQCQELLHGPDSNAYQCTHDARNSNSNCNCAISPNLPACICQLHGDTSTHCECAKDPSLRKCQDPFVVQIKTACAHVRRLTDEGRPTGDSETPINIEETRGIAVQFQVKMKDDSTKAVEIQLPLTSLGLPYNHKSLQEPKVFYHEDSNNTAIRFTHTSRKKTERLGHTDETPKHTYQETTLNLTIGEIKNIEINPMISANNAGSYTDKIFFYTLPIDQNQDRKTLKLDLRGAKGLGSVYNSGLYTNRNLHLKLNYYTYRPDINTKSLNIINKETETDNDGNVLKETAAYKYKLKDGESSNGTINVADLEAVPRLCHIVTSPLMMFFSDKRPHFRNTSEFPLMGGSRIYWPEKNHAGYFLAFDRNKDGQITEAYELFGNNAQAKNGFEALRSFDSNKDRVIDSRDAHFSKLVLWKDKNGNGIGEASELQPLSKKNVKWISLNYTPPILRKYGRRAEEKQNSFFAYKDKKGKAHYKRVIDVWFYAAPMSRKVAQKKR